MKQQPTEILTAFAEMKQCGEKLESTLGKIDDPITRQIARVVKQLNLLITSSRELYVNHVLHASSSTKPPGSQLHPTDL